MKRKTTTNEPPQEEERGIFGSSLPDTNTAEAIRYGSQYGFLKTAEWMWSALEDYLQRKLRGLESRIMDRGFAYYIITQNRSVLRTPTPPFSPERNMDVFTIRDYERTARALAAIPELRKKNELWARKQALNEYISSFRDRGEITPDDWKLCNNVFNMEPINYEFLKGKAREQQDEEIVDWNKAVNAMFPRTPRNPDGYVESEYEDEEPSEELDEEDDIAPLQEFAREWLEDPISESINMLEDRDDMLDTAYAWLDNSDWDPRSIVINLLASAEEIE